MKTLNFKTLLELAAAAVFFGLPARAGATAPATFGSSPAAGLAAAYQKAAASPVKSLLLPGRALEGNGCSEVKWIPKTSVKPCPPAGVTDAVGKALQGPVLAELKVKSEEGAPRAKRVSRLQEPGEAMGGGKERKEAAAKRAASGERE